MNAPFGWLTYDLYPISVTSYRILFIPTNVKNGKMEMRAQLKRVNKIKYEGLFS